MRYENGRHVSPRENELTAVTERAVFDAYPGPNLGRTPEKQSRWVDFREKYNAAHTANYVPDFPLQLDFELNSTCQLRCAFCLHGQQVVKRKDLPFELFLKAIQEAAEHNLVSVKFNYINEPLLVPDLERYIACARSFGVLNTYFATNGILLTQERARTLIASGLSKIMVSIDAATADTYRAVRGAWKFTEVVANVTEFVQLRERLGREFPKVRVNFVRTEVNAHEEEAFVKYWSGIADSIGLQTQVAVPGDNADLYRVQGVQQDASEFKCSFPFKLLVIDASGNILPCCTFSGRSMPLGNIADTTLAEAWYRARGLRELHMQSRWQENPACKHCMLGGAQNG